MACVSHHNVVETQIKVPDSVFKKLRINNKDLLSNCSQDLSWHMVLFQNKLSKSNTQNVLHYDSHLVWMRQLKAWIKLRKFWADFWDLFCQLNFLLNLKPILRSKLLQFNSIFSHVKLSKINTTKGSFVNEANSWLYI